MWLVYKELNFINAVLVEIEINIFYQLNNLEHSLLKENMMKLEKATINAKQ